MDLTLKRAEYDSFGIFGEILDDSGNVVCTTLEHAYDSGNGNGSYLPKVAPGIYKCIRHTPNRLPYETFEVTNVPNFDGNPVTGILIHKGNFDKDSEGCILVGATIASLTDGTKMVTSSAPTFNKFMSLQSGIDNFTLTVI
jgi:Family of unknown function (DUF5675)